MILKTKLFKRVLLAILAVYFIAICAPYVFVAKPPGDLRASAEIEQSTGCGDRATILPTGAEAMNARLNLIANAQTSLSVGTYLLADDESGQTIVSALLDAADRGVKVRIITDGMIGSVNLMGSNLGYVLAAHENIEFRYYNPIDLLAPWHLNARYHEKYVIADDHIMLLGGRNLSNEFLTSEGHEQYNYDMDVLIWREFPAQESAISTMVAYFDQLWDQHCAPPFESIPKRKEEAVQALTVSLGESYKVLAKERADLLVPPDWEALTVPIDGFALLQNPTSPGNTTPTLWTELITLMRGAKERIWIQTPYLVLNRQMSDDLKAVASLPTEMRILTNSRASGNNIIASADAVIHSGMYKRMDFELLEFHDDHSMHTKAMLLDDDISIIGSFNFDMRSVYIDTELMLVIKSKEINNMLENHMNTMFAKSLPVNASASSGEYGSTPPKEINFGKQLLIYLASPIVSLFRFLA